MRHGIAALMLGAIALCIPGGAWAQATDGAAPPAQGNYQDIVTRNAFALNPIPVATKTEAVAPVSPVDVFITGITTLSGVKKVLLQVADKGKKPEFPPPLIEGDIQGRVEVVSINPEKGAAVIKIDGNEKTLSLDKDSPKPGGAPPAGGVPNPLAPNPAGTIPLPGVTSAAAAAAAAHTGRMGVMMGGGAASVPAPARAAGAGAVGVGTIPATGTYPQGATGVNASGLPSRPLRTDSSGVMMGGAGATTAGADTATPAPTLTRDQAYAHIEQQRQLYNEAVSLGLIPQNRVPPMPPTPMTPKAGGAGTTPGPQTPGQTQ